MVFSLLSLKYFYFISLFFTLHGNNFFSFQIHASKLSISIIKYTYKNKYKYISVLGIKFQLPWNYPSALKITLLLISNLIALILKIR